jgi:hypothetical protein
MPVLLRLFEFPWRLDIMDVMKPDVMKPDVMKPDVMKPDVMKLDGMKRLVLLLSCSAALVCGADLANVHTVYVLQMSKGMDQYLANRLTNDHVFQVVTDPKLADAVLTDRIGESFQAKLEELFPSPEPEQPAKEKEEVANAQPGGLLAEPVNKLASPGANSSFGHATGTVFLVDVKSRQVIWSAYDLPRDGTSRQLDRTASDIVSRINRELNKRDQKKK